MKICQQDVLKSACAYFSKFTNGAVGNKDELVRFSDKKVKSQGHSETKCTFPMEAYRPTVRRWRPSSFRQFCAKYHKMNSVWGKSVSDPRGLTTDSLHSSSSVVLCADRGGHYEAESVAWAEGCLLYTSDAADE